MRRREWQRMTMVPFNLCNPQNITGSTAVLDWISIITRAGLHQRTGVRRHCPQHIHLFTGNNSCRYAVANNFSGKWWHIFTVFFRGKLGSRFLTVKQVCVHSRASAVNKTLPSLLLSSALCCRDIAISQYLLSARHPTANPLYAAAAAVDKWDRPTDARPLHLAYCADSVSDSYRTHLITNVELCLNTIPVSKN